MAVDFYADAEFDRDGQLVAPEAPLEGHVEATLPLSSPNVEADNQSMWSMILCARENTAGMEQALPARHMPVLELEAAEERRLRADPAGEPNACSLLTPEAAAAEDVLSLPLSSSAYAPAAAASADAAPATSGQTTPPTNRSDFWL